MEINDLNESLKWKHIYSFKLSSSIEEITAYNLDLSIYNEVLLVLFTTENESFVLTTSIIPIYSYYYANIIDVIYAKDTSYYARLYKAQQSSNCDVKVNGQYTLKMFAR